MKKIIIFTSLLVALFLIVSCNKTETPAFTVGEIIESIEITYQAGDDQDHVTKISYYLRNRHLIQRLSFLG